MSPLRRSAEPAGDVSLDVSLWTDEQRREMADRLATKLQADSISTRPGQSGKSFSYIEIWRVIERANEIFGFDGWNSQIMDIHQEFMEVGKDGRASVGYSVVMRVTLRCGTFHEDVGYGSMEKQTDRGKAIENAKKEAVSDATKRALKSFGHALGLSIYDTAHLQELKEREKGAAHAKRARTAPAGGADAQQRAAGGARAAVDQNASPIGGPGPNGGGVGGGAAQGAGALRAPAAQPAGGAGGAASLRRDAGAMAAPAAASRPAHTLQPGAHGVGGSSGLAAGCCAQAAVQQMAAAAAPPAQPPQQVGEGMPARHPAAGAGSIQPRPPVHSGVSPPGAQPQQPQQQPQPQQQQPQQQQPQMPQQQQQMAQQQPQMQQPQMQHGACCIEARPACAPRNFSPPIPGAGGCQPMPPQQQQQQLQHGQPAAWSAAGQRAGGTCAQTGQKLAPAAQPQQQLGGWEQAHRGFCGMDGMGAGGGAGGGAAQPAAMMQQQLGHGQGWAQYVGCGQPSAAPPFACESAQLTNASGSPHALPSLPTGRGNGTPPMSHAELFALRNSNAQS